MFERKHAMVCFCGAAGNRLLGNWYVCYRFCCRTPVSFIFFLRQDHSEHIVKMNIWEVKNHHMSTKAYHAMVCFCGAAGNRLLGNWYVCYRFCCRTPVSFIFFLRQDHSEHIAKMNIWEVKNHHMSAKGYRGVPLWCSGQCACLDLGRFTIDSHPLSSFCLFSNFLIRRC